jgi:hypothetical protein
MLIGKKGIQLFSFKKLTRRPASPDGKSRRASHKLTRKSLIENSIKKIANSK